MLVEEIFLRNVLEWISLVDGLISQMLNETLSTFMEMSD